MKPRNYQRGILPRVPKPWTAQEIELAEHLLNSGADDATIFLQLGRTRQAVRDKLQRVRQPVDPSYHRATMFGQISTITIPEEVIEDRNKRLAAEPVDLTALLMGDPTPGRRRP